MGVILAMKATISKGCTKLWIEYDSQLVNHAWSNTSIIPSDLQSIWMKYLLNCNTTCIHFSHTFRDNNQCVDKTC
uniref:RNase H type-1 domain-containing protein n=1 Tax=Phaseolus vulgaris TaxID=3885 RepID=V7B9U6_PHAVU|nr:hypothetical protein PHAVU_007G005000g [Phaseolus vulgaris]ESW14637.1 hypothetical protein PHAVU_007G005000g [Phaseolus vulgaris]